MADPNVTIKISATDATAAGVKSAEQNFANLQKTVESKSLAMQAKDAKKERRASGQSALGQMMSSPEGMVNFAMEKAGIGVAALAIDQIGKALAASTAKMVEFSDAMRKGEANAADFSLELLKSTPIIGGFSSAGENINEMLTHTKRDAREAAEALALVTANTTLFNRVNREAKGTGLLGEAKAKFDAQNKLKDTGREITDAEIKVRNNKGMSDETKKTELAALSQARIAATKASEIETARIEEEWAMKRHQARVQAANQFAQQEADLHVAALTRTGHQYAAAQATADNALAAAEKARQEKLKQDKFAAHKEGRDAEIPQIEKESQDQSKVDFDKHAESMNQADQDAHRHAQEVQRAAGVAAVDAQAAAQAAQLHAQNQFFDEKLAGIKNGAARESAEIDAQAEIAACQDEENRGAIMAKAAADKAKVLADSGAAEAQARKEQGLQEAQATREAAEAQAAADGEAKETELKKQGRGYQAESERIERERAAKVKSIQARAAAEAATADVRQRAAIAAKADAEIQKTNQDAGEAARQLLMQQVGGRGAPVTAGALSGRYGTGVEAIAKHENDPVRDLVKSLQASGKEAADFHKAALDYFARTPPPRLLTARGG